MMPEQEIGIRSPHPPRRPYKSGKTRTQVNGELRAIKKANNICINGRTDGLPGRGGVIHGAPVTRGGKCAHCKAVHKKSRSKA
jgi:hypothetical protein